jgi:hypothetical protein
MNQLSLFDDNTILTNEPRIHSVIPREYIPKPNSLVNYSNKGIMKVSSSGLKLNLLAAQMLEHFRDDLTRRESRNQNDIEGFCISVEKLDALIWAFDLWPEEPLVSFDFACEATNWDPEVIRDRLGKRMRAELTCTLKIIKAYLGDSACEQARKKLLNYIYLPLNH